MPQVPHIDIEIHGRCAAPDREMANLAGIQDGVVSRKELVGQGLGRGAIDHRVATGNLHVIHHGVYAVGHRALSRRGYLQPDLVVNRVTRALTRR